MIILTRKNKSRHAIRPMMLVACVALTACTFDVGLETAAPTQSVADGASDTDSPDRLVNATQPEVSPVASDGGDVTTEASREATATSRPTTTSIPATTASGTVSTPTPLPTASATPTATPCPFTWLAEIEEATGAAANSCPSSPPVASFAAGQYFESGAMIWVEEIGRYYILPYNSDGFPAGIVSIFDDPLTIYHDTSAEVTPPEGLYAPVSGFGLLWRGDTNPEGNSIYRDIILGWALAPEFGYETVHQCGLTVPTPHGGTTISATVCYLHYPDGRLIQVTKVSTQPWIWSFR